MLAESGWLQRNVYAMRWAMFLTCLILMTNLLPEFCATLWQQPIRIKADSCLFSLECRLPQVIAAVLYATASDGAYARRQCASEEVRPQLGLAWMPLGLTVLILVSVALSARAIRYSPVSVNLMPFFDWHNLFLVVIPEEILFRQGLDELLRQSANGFMRKPCARLAVGAFIFGLGHVAAGPLMVLLSSIAVLGYGWARWRSQSILGGVLAHFTVTLLHFSLFSYPALN